MDSTCWTLIEGAARGVAKDCDEIARRYSPTIRAYFLARWRAAPLCNEIDDAAQEVLFDCFRSDGALSRADREHPSGFRSYLLGICRIVGLRIEARARQARLSYEESEVDRHAVDDKTPSAAFDRAWARTVVQDALDGLRRQAGTSIAAERRIRLLNERILNGVPIRELVKKWEIDADLLHHEFARARNEFKSSLAAALRFHLGTGTDPTDANLRHLLELLK